MKKICLSVSCVRIGELVLNPGKRVQKQDLLATPNLKLSLKRGFMMFL